MTSPVGTEKVLKLVEVKPAAGKDAHKTLSPKEKILSRRIKKFGKIGQEGFDLVLKRLKSKKKPESNDPVIAFILGTNAHIPDVKETQIPSKPQLKKIAGRKQHAFDIPPKLVLKHAAHQGQPVAANEIKESHTAEIKVGDNFDRLHPNSEKHHLNLKKEAPDLRAKGVSVPSVERLKVSRESSKQTKKSAGEKNVTPDAVKKKPSRATARHLKSVSSPVDAAVAKGPDTTTQLPTDAKNINADIVMTDPGSVPSGLGQMNTSTPSPISTPNILQQNIQLARSVGIQIRHSINDSKNGPIEITLDPVELGKVRLTLHATDGGMNVQIVADRVETVDLMRRNSAVIQQEFDDLGFREFNFSFSEHNGQQQRGTDYVKNDDWSAPETWVPPAEIAPLALSVGSLAGAESLDLRL